ncbi:MAG TPA: UvrB/UvrC motif-containing protein [Candidatus Krumholzibacteria bacterium]|nr:UvrB/UvrC motif-containing protein [Candidatus Krumholzibacteria bacterium]HPD71702.1 UvrB/UvrC motif-containing protein [Candidatus Krumholzibacteria bacterium]HRY41365.1 UvrB/UvrC motif-containing protein [Candidatus Krumholzibacteria bacterium]
MNCERCGSREAQVKYIEVEEGVKRVRWLCEVCAAEEGAAQPPVAGDEVGANLQAFLGGVAPAPALETPPPACPACGVGLDQLQETGLLGCPRCYVHFREQLLPLLRRYHRAGVHLGKAPRARGPRAALRLEIGQLRSALEGAIAREDFEEAARLRDLIARRQATLGSLAEPERQGER